MRLAITITLLAAVAMVGPASILQPALGCAEAPGGPAAVPSTPASAADNSGVAPSGERSLRAADAASGGVAVDGWPNTFHFTSPQDVSRPRGGSRTMDAALSNRSGEHLVWVQDSDNGSRVIHARFDAEGGKLINDEITSSPNTSSSPRVVANADGSVDIAWLDNRTGTLQVFLTILSPIDEFLQSELQLTDWSNERIEGFALDIGPTGELCIVQALTDTSSTGPGGSFVLTRYDVAGRAVLPTVELLRTDYRPANFSIAVDANGSIHLVWVEPFGPHGHDIINPGLFYAKFNGSGALEGGPAMVSIVSMNSTMSIAAGDDGGATIAFDDDRYYTNDVFYTKVFGNGSAATEDTIVSSLDGYNSSRPDIAAGKEGEFYIAWQDESSGKGDILLSTVPEGLGPQKPARIPTGAISTANVSFEPKLMVDDSNDILVAWLESGAANGSSGTNRTNATGGVNSSLASGDVMLTKTYRPDLAITVSPVPGQALLADCSTAFRIIVDNIGKGGAAATSWTLTRYGELLAQGDATALEKGQNWTTTLKMVLKRGPQSLVARADTMGAVVESMEENNAYVLDIVGIYYDIGVSLDSPGPIPPGANATLSVSVANQGNVNDSFNLTVDGPSSPWLQLLGGPYDVGAGATRRVDGLIAVPAGVLAGTYPLNITAASLGPTAVRTRVRLDVLVAYVPDIFLQMPSALEVLPGTAGHFNVSAFNSGNGKANLTLSIVGMNLTAVSVSPQNILLNLLDSKTFRVNVTLPPGVSAGQAEPLRVDVLDLGKKDASGRPMTVASANITITAGLIRGMAIKPDMVAIWMNETEVEYVNVTFTNLGNAHENYSLNVEVPNRVRATPELNRLQLEAGGTVVVGVRIEVLYGCWAGDQSIRFRARTTDGAIDTAGSTRLTVAMRSGLTVTTDRPTREVVKGQTRLVSFPVVISNTGNYRDTYDFYMDGTYLNYTLELGDKKLVDWHILDTANLTLPPGENRTILVNWLVTRYETHGTTNLTFRVVSEIDNNVTASILLRVRFKPVAEGPPWVLVAALLTVVIIASFFGIRAWMSRGRRGGSKGKKADLEKRRLAIQNYRLQAAARARSQGSAPPGGKK